jgi:pyocin large subunit-like protein
MKRTCKNNHLARAPYSTRRHKRYHHTQKKSGGKLPGETYFNTDGVYSSIVALLDDKKITDGHTLLTINEKDWTHYDDIIIRTDKKRRVYYVNKCHDTPFIYKKKKFKAITDMKKDIEYTKCAFSLEHRLTLLVNKIRNSNNESEKIKNILENNYYVYGNNIIDLIKKDVQREIWDKVNDFSILISGLIEQKLVGTSDAEKTQKQEIIKAILDWNTKYKN